MCSKGKRVPQTPWLTFTAELRPENTPTAELGPSSHSTGITQNCHRTALPLCHPPPKTLRFSFLCILSSDRSDRKHQKKKKSERSCEVGKEPREAWWLLSLSAVPTCLSHLPHFPTQLTFWSHSLPFAPPIPGIPSLLHLLTSLPAGGLEETKSPACVTIGPTVLHLYLNCSLPHEPVDSYGKEATLLWCLTCYSPE